MRHWLISRPNQFSPRYKWEAFLKEMETHPGKDDLKREIDEVRGYLEATTARRRRPPNRGRSASFAQPPERPFGHLANALYDIQWGLSCSGAQ